MSSVPVCAQAASSGQPRFASSSRLTAVEMVCVCVFQLDQLVVDAAKEKRDMEQKHSTIQQKVEETHTLAHSHSLSPYPWGGSLNPGSGLKHRFEGGRSCALRHEISRLLVLQPRPLKNPPRDRRDLRKDHRNPTFMVLGMFCPSSLAC